LISFFKSITALLLFTGTSHALTYQLAGSNASWPADKRAAIVSAMNAAVALYNANGYFPRHLTANYNAGVPTAQANYEGWIDFGGSIGTRVALHELELGPQAQYLHQSLDRSARARPNGLVRWRGRSPQRGWRALLALWLEL
jgi:hypothetical protein